MLRWVTLTILYVLSENALSKPFEKYVTCVTCPLWRESNRHRWIPFKKGQQWGQRFHVMTLHVWWKLTCHRTGRKSGLRLNSIAVWHIMDSSKGTHQWWRHQMETFSAWLAIYAGNSLVPGEFPAKRPATWSFDGFFDLRLNKRLSKQSWGWWFETLSRLLWRHRNANYIGKSWVSNRFILHGHKANRPMMTYFRLLFVLKKKMGQVDPFWHGLIRDLFYQQFI